MWYRLVRLGIFGTGRRGIKEEEMEVIFIILLIIWLISYFAVSIITLFEAENEENIFRFAFYVQIKALIGLVDEINDVGCIIIFCIITLFTLPANIILLILKILEIVVTFLWHTFKEVFRRKNENN